jgi:hypothetical protein
MSPRRDRWVRLYELGQLLQKKDKRLEKLGRRALRQHAHRVVLEFEDMHGERITKKWRSRLYVSVGALDALLPLDEQVISRVERNQAEANQKIKALERQTNAHGSRIRTLERWRELTTEYVANISKLVGLETDS